MGKSSETAEEGEVAGKKTAIFCIHHPCHFLEQLLSSLLRCLGLDYGFRANQASHSPKPLDHSDVSATAGNDEEDAIVTAENSGSNDQVSYQYDGVPASPAEQAADPPSSMANQQFTTSSLTNRGSRRSRLSEGPGPQTN